METLEDIKAAIDTARTEVRQLQRSVARSRHAVSLSRQDAWGDDDIAARLEEDRLDQLRTLEGDVLARIGELRQVERDARDRLGSGLGLKVSEGELEQAARLAVLFPDPEAMPIEEITMRLRAAVLHADRGGQAFWAERARARLREDAAGFGTDSGRERAELARLAGEAHANLRDASADAVLAAADGLRDAAVDLKGEIDTARANRGEGPRFDRPGTRTAKIPGSSTHDVTGYVEVGVVEPGW